MKNIRIRIPLDCLCVGSSGRRRARLRRAIVEANRDQRKPQRQYRPQRVRLVKPTVLVPDRTPVKPATSTFTEAGSSKRGAEK